MPTSSSHTPSPRTDTPAPEGDGWESMWSAQQRWMTEWWEANQLWSSWWLSFWPGTNGMPWFEPPGSDTARAATPNARPPRRPGA